MAESAVNFLIQYLGFLLLEEGRFIKGVRGEARRIRDELESMRSFLRDADAKEDSNESIKTWVRQVREAAVDSEDMLDEFILHVGQHRQDARGVFGVLCGVARSIKQLKARHQIGTRIQDIRARLTDISRRKDDYNLNGTEQDSGLRNFNNGVYDPRLAALFAEESELVGIDKPRCQLIEWLLSGEQRLSTMSVVGMGGLGKTTLAKKVYDSELVKKHFETYAWITVSQTFKNKDLLQNMIIQFYAAKKEQAPSRLESMTDIQLIQELRDYLQNKVFLLVLDDIWSVDAWKFLSTALPTREYGSRVALTTRSSDVASSSCGGPSDYIYNLQPLRWEQAWSLFCKKAFRSNAENRCPLGLEKLARNFVKKCQGLPLAIVTLGSLLAVKDQTYTIWEMIHRSLGLELESDDQLKSVTRILLLSFNDLPYYLKSCFLYFSVFPEDYHIRRMKIIQLWMAEGFLERKEGRTPEEAGESYLNALIARSLIQVKKEGHQEDAITFHVHDLVREIIISKSREENLLASSNEDNIALSDRIRRLSIHNNCEIVPKFESTSRLRSFLSFGVDGLSAASAITSFAGLRLLRVVNIENVPLESFPEDLTSLLHLRYLNLQSTKIKHLPSSVCKLINLETLNLVDTFVCELPVEVLKLRRLRHLLVFRLEKANRPAFRCLHGAKVPSGVRSLRSLQNFLQVQAKSDLVVELGKLTQLRRLGVTELRSGDGRALCASIERMTHLKSLEVSSTDEDEEIDLHSLSCPPPALQYLLLFGHLKKLPQWIITLQNLHVIRLCWSGLKDDRIKALGSMPNLLELTLKSAYDGEELFVEDGDYPKLRELRLCELTGLKKVRVEKGAMPNLELLSIRCCEVLVEAPSWLHNLTKLKKLFLRDMPTAFLKGLQKDEGQEPADFIQHIPLVKCYDTERNKNWRLRRGPLQSTEKA